MTKVCPNDSFPLPHLDRLVEVTAGHQLLSFMDACSGYNQVVMNPDDQEKSSFITYKGIYCYKVMHFGLKNVRATYFVNRMFANHLGKTVEVFIDEMFVKSAEASQHVEHLHDCIKVLNEFGIKLNPAKCTFAITSREFLENLVTERGIEANPNQITTFLRMLSPKTTREMQRLASRIVTINRFISQSKYKYLIFFQLLKGNKQFE